MALLNGSQTSFEGLSPDQIGDRLLEASSSGDGRNIVLELSLHEEPIFIRLGGMAVGYVIAGLIVEAIERKTGVHPRYPMYNYLACKFRT